MYAFDNAYLFVRYNKQVLLFYILLSAVNRCSFYSNRLSLQIEICSINMAAFDRDAATMRVIEELKRLYKTKILPLEQMYRFDLFNSPYLTDAEFDSKPQV